MVDLHVRTWLDAGNVEKGGGGISDLDQKECQDYVELILWVHRELICR
jgi:hypothetical protein